MEIESWSPVGKSCVLWPVHAASFLKHGQTRFPNVFLFLFSRYSV